MWFLFVVATLGLVLGGDSVQNEGQTLNPVSFVTADTLSVPSAH